MLTFTTYSDKLLKLRTN